MRDSWITFMAAMLIAVASPAIRAAEPNAAELERLKESLAKWEKARQECEGNYTYTVRRSSAFGFGHQTTITVKDNKVVERMFEEFGQPVPPKPGEQPEKPKPRWIETGKDVGTHKTEGAPARTVDELYGEAKKLLEMTVPENHKLYLSFDKQGVLSHCFTIDTRIADDAPTKGIPPFKILLPMKK